MRFSIQMSVRTLVQATVLGLIFAGAGALAQIESDAAEDAVDDGHHRARLEHPGQLGDFSGVIRTPHGHGDVPVPDAGGHLPGGRIYLTRAHGHLAQSTVQVIDRCVERLLDAGEVALVEVPDGGAARRLERVDELERGLAALADSFDAVARDSA